MRESTTSLQFTFVFPPEWGFTTSDDAMAKMFIRSDDDDDDDDNDETPTDDDRANEVVVTQPQPEPGVRVKIENGVVFFKPAVVGAADVIAVERLSDNLRWRAHISANHPMVERLSGQLERLGWSLRHPFFELHPAQRGWHGISLGPLRQKPLDRPWVRVKYISPAVIEEEEEEPVLVHGPITADDVARILAKNK